MIRITIYQNQSSEVTGFDSIGHAGYADHGEDIVCAGVSALVLNGINSVEELTDLHFSVEAVEDTGEIRFRLEDKPSSQSELLFKSMILGLKGIQESYKKYITLNFREV